MKDTNVEDSVSWSLCTCKEVPSAGDFKNGTTITTKWARNTGCQYFHFKYCRGKLASAGLRGRAANEHSLEKISDAALFTVSLCIVDSVGKFRCSRPP